MLLIPGSTAGLLNTRVHTWLVHVLLLLLLALLGSGWETSIHLQSLWVLTGLPSAKGRLGKPGYTPLSLWDLQWVPQWFNSPGTVSWVIWIHTRNLLRDKAVLSTSCDVSTGNYYTHSTLLHLVSLWLEYTPL